jgi:hypothetical protein
MSNAAGQARSRTQEFSVPGFLSAEKRHTLFLFLMALAAIVLALTLTYYGWSYYTLDQAHRPFSAKHALLRPGGKVGLRLGIVGFVLFVLVYLFPLRKRWPALARIGKTKQWLDFHVMLGLMAPVVITFHSSFKISGFAGMAYWTMIALMISGLVGRYFYAQIPRHIGAAEMSLKEMQEVSAELLEALNNQKVLTVSSVERLLRLPSSQEVQSMPLLHALFQMAWLDIARPFKVWSLRRHASGFGGSLLCLGGVLRTRHVELERIVSLASRQAALSKRILFLAKTHRVFHLWHVIHRPFSLSFAVFVIIHVVVVMALGYF